MKRILFILSVLLLSSLARANGKITVSPVYFFNEHKVWPKVGLSIYEKIAGPVYFTSWTGYGRDYGESDHADWFVSKAGFDLYLPKGFTLGVGAGVEYDIHAHALQPTATASVSYRIW